MRREAFARHVRDALANLYNPIHLQTHPLLETLRLTSRPGATAGEQLRALLWQVIEELEPDAALPAESPKRLGHRLLWLHYIQGHAQEQVCRELGLSQRSFYRYQAEAVEAVAGVLWERHRVDERPSTGAGGAPLPARDEAVRLAQQAPRQPVDLAQVINRARETAAPLAAAQGVALTIEAAEDLPSAIGDPAMLHQMLLNVLVEGTRLSADDSLVLSVTAGDAGTLWRLADLDPLRAPDRDVLQAQGLHVSAGLLGVYGGRMWLERGALGRQALCFSLPLTPARTILLVDDDAETVSLYRRYLQAEHYQVRAARNAGELDEELARGAPEAMLLDVLMPHEDGWSILQRLKTLPETAAVPVIVCSVLSQPELALALGAARVLQKPVSADDLSRAVAEVLARPDSSGSTRPAAPART